VKLPALKPKHKEVELTPDGYSLDGLASLRSTVLNEHQPLPRRAACLDALPAEYRCGLPAEVDDARQEFKAFLVHGHGTG